MVNDFHSPITKVEEKNKQYTGRNVKRDDRSRWFHKITDQPVNQILHAVDKNILQNLPIFREDVWMAEDIYGPSVPNLQGKTFRHNIQHVIPIIIPNIPNRILDKYKKVILCYDLMYINGIDFLSNISRHIMFATGSMIKYWKIKNTEYGIKQVHKL